MAGDNNYEIVPNYDSPSSLFYRYKVLLNGETQVLAYLRCHAEEWINQHTNKKEN